MLDLMFSDRKYEFKTNTLNIPFVTVRSVRYNLFSDPRLPLFSRLYQALWIRVHY